MSKLINDALIFATEKHAGQSRKYTGQPYIFHPIAVAMMVMETPDHTDDMVAAALLHDVVEDCGVHLDEVGARFGDGVKDLVYWLTDIATPADGNRAKRKEIEREKWDAATTQGRKRSSSPTCSTTANQSSTAIQNLRKSISKRSASCCRCW